LTVNFPVRDDLPCGGYLLDLSLHRHSYARHHLGYGAMTAGAFHCGGHCCKARGGPALAIAPLISNNQAERLVKLARVFGCNGRIASLVCRM
jgi:hypothetical protein